MSNLITQPETSKVQGVGASCPFLACYIKGQIVPGISLASPALIEATVAEFYGLTVADLKIKRRTLRICWPRHVAAWLLRDIGGLSLVGVASQVGYRDHGSVLHAYKKVNDMRECYPELRQELDKLREAILAKAQPATP